MLFRSSIVRITLCSFKGGVAKTVSAVHLAAYLQQKGNTLLVDGDPNRSASDWAAPGNLPFQVKDETEVTRQVLQNFEHVVIDTQARPSADDLAELASGCDLLILPTTPDVMSLRALMLTIQTLKPLKLGHHKALVTVIPPSPSSDGEEAKQELQGLQIPVFKTGIRRLVALQKAVMGSCLVHETGDPRGIYGWEDYASIGKELLK